MTTKNFEQLKQDVIQWACERRIIPNAKASSQLLKAVSEMGELCDAENHDDTLEIKDAVGDVLVCIINYCALREIDIVDCLNGAYEVIKDRKGTLMPSGVFVKDGK